jgi:putative sugar O-methyltransferase
VTLPELAPMFEEMERAPRIVRPSAFWEVWNERNLKLLADRGFADFKRTINHNYFNWVPRSPLNDQFRVVARDWLRRRAGHAPFHARLTDTRGLDLLPTRMHMQTHAVFLALLWEYVRARDPHGLLDVLEEPALGNPITVEYRGRAVCQDLSNSVHEITSMLEGSPPGWRPDRVIELGGGYGRVAWAMLRTFPSVRYVLVDIPPALAIAQRYLTELFDDRRVFRFRSFEDGAAVAEELDRAQIAFLTPNQLDLLAPLRADLFINISSLHEMRREQIAHYLRAVDTHCAGVFYTKQWESWHNLEDDIVIDRASYPIPAHWRAIYSREHPIQVKFFEALYRVGG